MLQHARPLFKVKTPNLPVLGAQGIPDHDRTAAIEHADTMTFSNCLIESRMQDIRDTTLPVRGHVLAINRGIF
eukprot:1354443-Rhodomonas_salina.1